MKFELTDKQRTVQRTVRAFCQSEIVPIAKDIDQEARFPWDVVEKISSTPTGHGDRPQTPVQMIKISVAE